MSTAPTPPPLVLTTGRETGGIGIRLAFVVWLVAFPPIAWAAFCLHLALGQPRAQAPPAAISARAEPPAAGTFAINPSPPPEVNSAHRVGTGNVWTWDAPR